MSGQCARSGSCARWFFFFLLPLSRTYVPYNPYHSCCTFCTVNYGTWIRMKCRHVYMCKPMFSTACSSCHMYTILYTVQYQTCTAEFTRSNTVLHINNWLVVAHVNIWWHPNLQIWMWSWPWPRQHPSHVMFVTHHAQHHIHSYNIYAPMLPVCSNMTGPWSWAVGHYHHQLTRNKKHPTTPSKRTMHPRKQWKQQSTANSCLNLNPCGTMMMAWQIPIHSLLVL